MDLDIFPETYKYGCCFHVNYKYYIFYDKLLCFNYDTYPIGNNIFKSYEHNEYVLYYLENKILSLEKDKYYKTCEKYIIKGDHSNKNIYERYGNKFIDNERITYNTYELYDIILNKKIWENKCHILHFESGIIMYENIREIMLGYIHDGIYLYNIKNNTHKCISHLIPGYPDVILRHMNIEKNILSMFLENPYNRDHKLFVINMNTLTHFKHLGFIYTDFEYIAAYIIEFDDFFIIIDGNGLNNSYQIIKCSMDGKIISYKNLNKMLAFDEVDNFYRFGNTRLLHIYYDKCIKI